MKILVEPPASLTTVNYLVGGRDRLALTGAVGFSLLPGGGLTDQPQTWSAAMESLAPYADLGLVFDAGLPKPRGEFLCAGQAFAEGGGLSAGLTASLSVGPLRRDFLALGDQFFEGPRPTAPKPFRAMPLGWAQTAFDSVTNPYGQTPGRTLGAEGRVLAVVNVTEAFRGLDGRLVPGGSTAPASPLPRPMTADRLKNLGDFGPEWLKNAWPGFPADFDFEFFNAAQLPQRLAKGHFRGDEPVVAARLHPDHPRLVSALPGRRLRILALRRAAGSVALVEVEPVLDTVWLFPNFAIGMALWHASLSAADEQASDLPEIVAGLEELDRPPAPAAELWARAQAGWVEPELAAAAPAAAPPELEPVQPETKPPEAPDAGPALATLSAVELPQASPPAFVVAAVMDETRRRLEADLPELNRALAAHGLRSATMADFEPHLAEQEKTLNLVLDTTHVAEPAALAADADAAPALDPALKQTLAQQGLSPEQIADLEKAMQMPPPPDRADFLSDAQHEQAVSSYGTTMARLLGQPPAAAENAGRQLVMAVRAAAGSPEALAALLPLPPDQAAGLAETFLKGPPSAEEQKAALIQNLVASGLSPAQSEEIHAAVTALDQSQAALAGLPFAGRAAWLKKSLQALGRALGVPAAVVDRKFDEDSKLVRQIAWGDDDLLGKPLDRLAVAKPELVPFMPEIHRLRKEQAGEFDSLAELVQAAGVHSPELTAAAAGLDLLNPPPPPPPPPPEPELELEPEPEPEPAETVPEQDANFFSSRDELEAFLAGAAAPSLAGAVMTGLNLSGLSLSGLDLSQADLRECDLSGSDLSNCRLVGAVLTGARLNEARLAGADLTGADLGGVQADGVQLGRAVFALADFSAADLSAADLEGLKADQAAFAETKLPKALAGASLAGAKFFNVELQGADLSGAALDEADFAESDLSGARFCGAGLAKTSFSNCRLQGADLQKVKGPGLKAFSGSDLTGAKLAGSDLAGAVFLGAVAKGCDWSGVKARQADFSGLDLAGSNFAGADLRQAVLFRADLTGVSFRGADLFKSSLSGARLKGADFAGASLYGADLYRIAIDKATSFKGADLENTCLKIGGSTLVGT
ncbi:MAG: pentapeptide repeat-containing protein [Deltaproteobacteria bacterium]|jgi:uncharacterized protein YjbI with pentapeptide repeats|nr:pentapeptide repeat-containing protein [Deltaproteobacteria bacterium]